MFFELWFLSSLNLITIITVSPASLVGGPSFEDHLPGLHLVLHVWVAEPKPLPPPPAPPPPALPLLCLRSFWLFLPFVWVQLRWLWNSDCLSNQRSHFDVWTLCGVAAFCSCPNCHFCDSSYFSLWLLHLNQTPPQSHHTSVYLWPTAVSASIALVAKDANTKKQQDEGGCNWNFMY